MQDEQTVWSYSSEAGPGDPEENKVPSSATVEWSASEFIAHEKSSLWYIVLIVVAAISSVIVYVLTRDYFTVGVVIVMAIAFGVYASRQPRTMQYRLISQGVQIGSRLYPYGVFKSFSVVNEGAINAIELMPLKRFMPPIIMYVAPDEEEKVMDSLSQHLPVEEHERGLIDNAMRHLRF